MGKKKGCAIFEKKELKYCTTVKYQYRVCFYEWKISNVILKSFPWKEWWIFSETLKLHIIIWKRFLLETFSGSHLCMRGCVVVLSVYVCVSFVSFHRSFEPNHGIVQDRSRIFLGGANPKGVHQTVIQPKFSWKLHENEENMTESGARVQNFT